MLCSRYLIQSHGLNTIQIPCDDSRIYNSSLDISAEFQTQTSDFSHASILWTLRGISNVTSQNLPFSPQLLFSVFLITTNNNFILWLSFAPGVWPCSTFSINMALIQLVLTLTLRILNHQALFCCFCLLSSHTQCGSQYGLLKTRIRAFHTYIQKSSILSI